MAIIRHFLLENWMVTSFGVVLGVALAYGLNFGIVTNAERVRPSSSQPSPPDLGEEGLRGRESPALVETAIRRAGEIAADEGVPGSVATAGNAALRAIRIGRTDRAGMVGTAANRDSLGAGPHQRGRGGGEGEGQEQQLLSHR
jgi:hypothetical protein